MDKNTKVISSVKKASNLYYPLAWLNLASDMDYLMGNYTGDGFYLVESTMKAVTEGDRQLLEQFATAVRNVLEGEMAEEALITLRERIMAQVEELTAYVGELAIYEDIFKRIQSSYREDVAPVDEEAAAREILQGVFSSEDPVVTNMRIQYMVSCLPVRMTKSRFYDLLAQNLALYKEADTQALESFRYRILSAASLCPTENSECYAEIAEGVKEFRNADLAASDEVVCSDSLSRLEAYGDVLVQEQDFLENLQRCVNNLLAIVLLKQGELSDESIAVEKTMRPAVEALLAGLQSFLAGEEVQESDEVLESIYATLEGRMEQIGEELKAAEAKLQALAEKDVQWAATEEAQRMGKISRLMSTSDYAQLEDEDPAEALTPETLAQATKEILEAFELGFANKHRRYIRSVMSFVLRELPVFFDSRTEVMNYVLQALQNCKSDGEKQLAIDEVRGLFEELPW